MVRRVVRIFSFMGLILPNLPLRLLPVLNGSPVLPASLLVQCVGTLGDLWSHIGRLPGDGVKNAPFDHRDLYGVIQNQAGRPWHKQIPQASATKAEA